VGLYKAEGLVLWTQPLGEADRLVGVLTPDRGKVRAVARGVLRSKGPLSAAVQPFVCARFVFWQGRELDGISQAEIAVPHRHLGDSLPVLAAAGYCCEVADALASEGQESAHLYALTVGALDWLDHPPAGGLIDVLLRWYELGALGAMGFAPQLLQCADCGAAVDPQERTLGFSPTLGGLLCHRCAGLGGGLPLSGSARAALHYLAGCPAAALCTVRVGPRTMGEMAQAIGAQLEEVVHRPIRSRGLLKLIRDPVQ